MNLYALIPLISVAAYIALIGIVLSRSLARVHKVFIFYLVTSMLWSFSSFILHAELFPTQALLWNRVLIVAGGAAVVIYYHFVRAFFNRSAGKSVYLGYAAIMGLAIFLSQGGMLKSSIVIDGILYHKLDPLPYYLFCIFGAAFTGMSIFYLVQGLRRATTPQDRNRIGYLLAAFGIWIPFSVTNLIPTLANYSVDHLGNIANSLIIGYAILRFQLLNIRFVMRRGLAYILVIICLAGIYVGSILLGHRFFPGQPLYNVLLLASGLTILLALLARPLRRVIQEGVDRFFYGETYSYRQALFSFSSKMGNIINLSELADEMLPAMSKALRIRQVKLLLEDTNSSDFITQFNYPKTEGESSHELRFTVDSPIITWLVQSNTPLSPEQIDNNPQFKGLWQTERGKFAASNLELLYPIKSRGKLIGILALGKKQPDTLYSYEDIELITSIASQAGIIIENARMLDSLKKQQLQMEQLLTEAIHAQEEERQRISADLHDSVAQWLASASYRAQAVDAHLSGNGSHKARSELATLESTIDKSLKELRRVLTGLRPPALDELGLNHALRQSLEELKADGLDCRFSVVGMPVRLPSSVEIAVYRAVQEALTNIRKHAHATKVSLRLQFKEDKLLVEIRDNGRGFDLSNTLDSAISVGHMGLLGMKQRAEMMGGGIRIMTGEGIGTTIIFRLPLQFHMEEK